MEFMVLIGMEQIFYVRQLSHIRVKVHHILIVELEILYIILVDAHNVKVKYLVLHHHQLKPQPKLQQILQPLL